MGAISWILPNWFELLQSVGIVAGLVLNAYARRKEARATEIRNYFATIEHHHEIWKQLNEGPNLIRILDQNATLNESPLTVQEERFVNSVIIHLDGVHRAIKARMFVKLEGIRRDVREFFSLPIPKAVWEKVKPLQNAEFVRFVESSLRCDD